MKYTPSCVSAVSQATSASNSLFWNSRLFHGLLKWRFADQSLADPGTSAREIILAALIAQELGGKRFAQSLTAWLR
jgi:hypothetical protein